MDAACLQRNNHLVKDYDMPFMRIPLEPDI